MQGELHLPDYVFPHMRQCDAAPPFPSKGLTIVVPSRAGGGDDDTTRMAATYRPAAIGNAQAERELNLPIRGRGALNPQ